jgi:L-fuconolactonase
VSDATGLGPLIDTHLHIWDLDTCEYGWLTPETGILHRTHQLDEVDPERQAAGVTGAVLVQAANSTCDTDVMLDAMASHPWVRGVVGWVDLTQGDDAAHDVSALAARPGIVGVRHLNHDEPDPEWLVRPAILSGLRAVATADLTFDAVAIWPLHLDLVPSIATAVPDLRIVIDHLAKPPIASGDLSAWGASMASAAAFPNVFAKVSGLDTAAGSPDWTPADLRPAFDIALDCFGPDRLMYGGDWPVSRLGGGYARQAAAFEALTADLAAREREAIRWQTAAQAYRLDVG